MADWNHTVILHEPRKLLGITVLEYTVLDVIYKSQTSPIYNVDGWSKNGCHQLAKFMGCSPATVLAILERMEVLGYLVINEVDKQLKKTTEAFYSIAYEKDKDNLAAKQGCSKTERVRKLNAHRSETEQEGVRKLNGECSETEPKCNLKESLIESKEKEVETSSTVTLIDEVDETSVEIHHVPDYFEVKDQLQGIPDKDKKLVYEIAKDIPGFFDTEQKKPKEKVAPKRKGATDNPTPIREMFDIYSHQYARMNGGEKPEFMPKYLQPMKKLYGILEARQIQSGIVPLEKLQPWRDFIEMWGKYLQDHPKETYFTANFNPATFYSQFNTIVAKLKNQPMTTEDKWKKFYRENTTG